MEAETLLVFPNILEYKDYRLYLRDVYEHYKKTTPYFSYRYFSKRAGLSSPNFLQLVINGKRNLSIESIERFAKALKLKKYEQRHFKNLVLYCQAKNQTEKIIHAEAILKEKRFKEIHPLKQIELKYYLHWYYIPIRELVATRDFQECPDWISSKFRIKLSRQEILGAIEDLLKIQLLSRDSKGRLIQTHKSIKSQDDLSSSIIRKYHKEMLDQAKMAIDEVSLEDREISGTCISCSKENVVKIKKLIQEFRKEILTLTDESQDVNHVYQMNFQLFPLTKGDI